MYTTHMPKSKQVYLTHEDIKQFPLRLIAQSKNQTRLCKM